MSSVTATTNERGSRYGSLNDNGFYSQSIKDVYRNSLNWDKMTPDKKEALDQIACKIARILSGDPEYADNWHDIQGYAAVVEAELRN